VGSLASSARAKRSLRQLSTAAAERRLGDLWHLTKPQARCAYCRRPLPKGRTQRRLYGDLSYAHMAYLWRKFHDTSAVRAQIADLNARQRRAETAAQVARHVNQALGETPGT
jgi:hypothetical protein